MIIEIDERLINDLGKMVNRKSRTVSFHSVRLSPMDITLIVYGHTE